MSSTRAAHHNGLSHLSTADPGGLWKRLMGSPVTSPRCRSAYRRENP